MFSVENVRCCNQLFNVANVSVPHSKRSSFTAKPNSHAGPREHTCNYVYAYSNDIHNVATNYLLRQQLFNILFFLIKFKTLGLIVELDLACLVNDGSFFGLSCC